MNLPVFRATPIIMAVAIVSASLSGCANPLYRHLPRGDAAYKVIPADIPAARRRAFLIAPGDELALNVVGEPDLSLNKVIVDDIGTIQVPLAGEVAVSGHTPGEATKIISDILASRGLRDPKVALNISSPVTRTVAIEGQVIKAGVYPITPESTLLTAVAMAQSTSKIARLDEVMIFRTTDNQRLVARFDLERIRAGVDPDPQLLPGDTVVVGYSYAKSIYRDALTAAPFFNLFTRF